MPFVLEENTCNFEHTGEYKYLDLYDSDFWTPTQKPNINQYTKEITRLSYKDNLCGKYSGEFFSILKKSW